MISILKISKGNNSAKRYNFNTNHTGTSVDRSHESGDFYQLITVPPFARDELSITKGVP